MNLLIGDTVKIKHKVTSADYVWNKKLLRVVDIFDRFIVLKRESDISSEYDYQICVTINDLICKDVILQVIRGGKKWILDIS